MPNAAAASSAPNFSSEDEARQYLQSRGITFGDQTGATTPPISQWPSVLKQTFHQAEPVMPSDELVIPAANWIKRQVGLGDYQQPVEEPAEPPVPKYGGPLGIAQQFARTAASPPALGAALATGPVGIAATAGGDVGHDVARQLGAPEWLQDIAGLFTGLNVGAWGDTAANVMAKAAKNPSLIAKDLSDAAGFALSKAGDINETMDAAGQTMKSAISGITIPRGPASAILRGIKSAGTGMEAVANAMKNPQSWKILPDQAKQALGAVYASMVKDNPDSWTSLDPAFRREIIPDATHQQNMTEAAMEATANQNAGGQTWLQKHGLGGVANLVNFLAHHWVSGATGGIGAGIASRIAGGAASPLGEIAAGTASALIPPTIKAVARKTAPVSAAMSLGQGKVGEPPDYNKNQLQP